MRNLKLVEKATPVLMRLVEEYLASCRARGLSPRTVKDAYAYPLHEVFLPFCQEEEASEPGQITKRLMDRLTTKLLDEGGRRGPLSRHTVASYVRSINLFLSWAAKEGEMSEVKAQAPKLPKRLLDVLSRDEIQKLEDVALNERDKLIVRVLADTGIRASELTSLRVDDLRDRDRSTYLRVRGKGDKERLVPVPRLARRLRRYAERGCPREVESERLFVGLRRRPGGGYEPLTRFGMAQVIRLLGEKAMPGKRVHPHLLRHSFATWSLTRGVNPVILAQIMGHNSLAMINDVYSHLSPQDSFDAIAKALGVAD
ncbi:MAG: tyrosine-type recombinase/integrase [Candidatus Dormibacteraceae bacterium]